MTRFSRGRRRRVPGRRRQPRAAGLLRQHCGGACCPPRPPGPTSGVAFSSVYSQSTKSVLVSLNRIPTIIQVLLCSWFILSFSWFILSRPSRRRCWFPCWHPIHDHPGADEAFALPKHRIPLRSSLSREDIEDFLFTKRMNGRPHTALSEFFSADVHHSSSNSNTM